MARREKKTLPTRDELLARLDAESRRGSVTATKILLEELRRDVEAETPEAELERLIAG